MKVLVNFGENDKKEIFEGEKVIMDNMFKHLNTVKQKSP